VIHPVHKPVPCPVLLVERNRKAGTAMSYRLDSPTAERLLHTERVPEDDQQTNDDLAQAASTFAALRPRLFGIAYRMLASSSDAEDIVQDVWVRWQSYDRRSTVVEPAAFLATITTRPVRTLLQRHARGPRTASRPGRTHLRDAFRGLAEPAVGTNGRGGLPGLRRPSPAAACDRPRIRAVYDSGNRA
jgi:hypothetical protein